MTPRLLRTRLIVAAERFANEIADAIEEASGKREIVEEEKPKRHARKRGARGKVPEAPVSTKALAKADEILERHGMGRRAG